MPVPLRSVLITLVVVIAAWALAPPTPPAASLAAPAAFATPTSASRGRTFTFAGVASGDQQTVATAVSAARPEAQRLIGAVAGLVTLSVGPTDPGAAGVTRTTATGYDVQLDLGMVSQRLGARGVERLVLHELGHVVDFALVPDDVLASLDAGIPRGYGCEPGRTGSCAEPAERFAESFAKWASDDIGVNLEIGYKVPPPTLPLDAWAQPLLGLGG